jgi:hypothetical protein
MATTPTPQTTPRPATAPDPRTAVAARDRGTNGCDRCREWERLKITHDGGPPNPDLACGDCGERSVRVHRLVLAEMTAACAPDAPTPPGTTVIVVRTLNYYGAGPTVAAALAECRKAGGARNLRTHGYVAHRLPDGIVEWSIGAVDGHLSWSWGDIDMGGGQAGKLPDATLVVDKRTKRAKGGR